jgi:hypothetical protein
LIIGSFKVIKPFGGSRGIIEIVIILKRVIIIKKYSVIKKIAGFCMHRTSISKEVDHTNIKITTEKSIEGIRCNSQSFSTIPCLVSILEKKVGSIRSIDANNLTINYPDIFEDAKCNDKDFATLPPLNENIHSDNTNNMCNNTVTINEKMTDCEFVDKMFLHFKSAVELCKLLIRSTKEPRLFTLAQTIIANEEKDMFEIAFLKNNLYNWKNLIPNKFYGL